MSRFRGGHHPGKAQPEHLVRGWGNPDLTTSSLVFGTTHEPTPASTLSRAQSAWAKCFGLRIRTQHAVRRVPAPDVAFTLWSTCCSGTSHPAARESDTLQRYEPTAALRARLKGRSDSEHEQALSRCCLRVGACVHGSDILAKRGGRRSWRIAAVRPYGGLSLFV